MAGVEAWKDRLRGLKPDVLAPGKSVLSVRSPGSTIDVANPSARVGTTYFVGSGTSFSAAITSGAAAILRQATPGGDADKIKGKLLGGAMRGPVGSPFVVRAAPIVQEAIGQMYKINFFMGEDIDPDMEGTP